MAVSEFQRGDGWLEKIDAALKIHRVGTPPGFAKKKQDSDQDRSDHHGAARAALAGVAREFASIEIAFADNPPDDEDCSHGQQQHEGEQERGKRLLQWERSLRVGRHRNGNLSLPLTPSTRTRTCSAPDSMSRGWR